MWTIHAPNFVGLERRMQQVVDEAHVLEYVTGAIQRYID